MPATNFTPIQLYRSTTASQVPTSGNLADGELAINTNDGKLYYKDSSGVVQLMASKAGASGDVVGPASATDNAVVRFDGTTGKLVQNSVVTIADSTGDVAGVGALTMGGNLTLSGGTANGVLYLNGSKVATSGSALTFDGTNLFQVNSGAGKLRLGVNTLDQFLDIYRDSGSGASVYNAAQGSGFGFHVWQVANTEQMRLTSTGLGIGTSSPAGRLEVKSSNTSRWWLENDSSATNTKMVFANSAGSVNRARYQALEHYFQTGNVTDAAIIDSSGNLGLGVTPSAWGTASSRRAIELPGGGNIWGQNFGGSNPSMQVYCNAYESSTGAKYVNSAHASGYQQNAGSHAWFTAPSGTAGNAITFTQAMTLDASGNLSLDGGGTYSVNNTKAYQVKDSGGTNRYALYMSGGVSPTAGDNLYLGTTINSPLVFFTNNTERARITSGGYFKASDNGTYFGSTGAYHEFRQTANAQSVIVSVTNASFTSESIFSTATKTAGTDWMHFYGTSDGNTVANVKIFGNGNVQNANNSYAGISDQKLKQDIVDAGSQWDDIKNLRVRKYRFKASPDAPLQIGLVAQEAETVSPGLVEETVDRNAEGNDLETTTKAVKYSVLYMKAIKALQEAMARIETLEAKVSALEGN